MNVEVKNKPRGFFRELYGQVLIATVLGVVIGHYWPNFGEELKPLGDGFIRLLRVLLAPVIFGTVVLGIARMENLKELGRVGLKALLYFEIVSSVALVLGLVAVNVLQPGANMNIDAARLDPKTVAAYTASAAQRGWVEFLLNIIPDTVTGAFVRGELLQVILFSVLFGVAAARIAAQSRSLLLMLENVLQALFGIVALVMRLAPLGALGGMAFTVGKYGIGSLTSLGQLVAVVYGTCIFFVLVILGAIARAAGFSLARFMRYIREEIIIVFATSSSEVVLPRMMTKLEQLGCARPVVGLVLPAGYTFNPDGTSIYLTIAAIFVAQATNTPLTWFDQAIVLGVLMLTSKGSAGVAGGGFIALAGTLASLGKIPVAGIVLLLGVERFINAARAVTNLIGNGVATLVIAGWEKALDRGQLGRELER